jgi:hypothetical protein
VVWPASAASISATGPRASTTLRSMAEMSPAGSCDRYFLCIKATDFYTAAVAESSWEFKRFSSIGSGTIDGSPRETATSWCIV